MKHFLSLFIFSLLFTVNSSLFAEQKIAMNPNRAVPVNFNKQINVAELSGPKGCIAIRLENIRNSEGTIDIALFGNEKGFPDKPEKAFALASVATKQSSEEIAIENIPFT